MTAALLIAWWTGRKITTPIADMSEFTKRMKQAPSLKEKIKVVTDLAKHEQFSDVNRQYMDMKAAKDLLKRRYEALAGAQNSKVQ